jgi:hypothetical protein
MELRDNERKRWNHGGNKRKKMNSKGNGRKRTGKVKTKNMEE